MAVESHLKTYRYTSDCIRYNQRDQPHINHSKQSKHPRVQAHLWPPMKQRPAGRLPALEPQLPAGQPPPQGVTEAGRRRAKCGEPLHAAA